MDLPSSEVSITARTRLRQIDAIIRYHFLIIKWVIFFLNVLRIYSNRKSSNDHEVLIAANEFPEIVLHIKH